MPVTVSGLPEPAEVWHRYPGIILSTHFGVRSIEKGFTSKFNYDLFVDISSINFDGNDGGKVYYSRNTENNKKYQVPSSNFLNWNLVFFIVS